MPLTVCRNAEGPSTNIQTCIFKGLYNNRYLQFKVKCHPDFLMSFLKNRKKYTFFVFFPLSVGERLYTSYMQYYLIIVFNR